MRNPENEPSPRVERASQENQKKRMPVAAGLLALLVVSPLILAPTAAAAVPVEDAPGLAPLAEPYSLRQTAPDKGNLWDLVHTLVPVDPYCTPLYCETDLPGGRPIPEPYIPSPITIGPQVTRAIFTLECAALKWNCEGADPLPVDPYCTPAYCGTNLPSPDDLPSVDDLPGMDDLPGLDDLPGVDDLPGLDDLPDPGCAPWCWGLPDLGGGGGCENDCGGGDPGPSLPSEVCVGGAEPARWCLDDPLPCAGQDTIQCARDTANGPIGTAWSAVNDVKRSVLQDGTLPGNAVCVSPTNNKVAVAITDRMVRNGGSWYQLFRAGKEIYVSYMLQPNTMVGGADYWVFGMEGYTDDSRSTVSWAKLWRNRQAADCEYWGLQYGNAPDPFIFFIDAGGIGTVGTTHCDITVSWEATVGVKFGPTGGGEASATLGQSVTCGASVTVDSESLIREDGAG